MDNLSVPTSTPRPAAVLPAPAGFPRAGTPAPSEAGSNMSLDSASSDGSYFQGTFIDHIEYCMVPNPPSSSQAASLPRPASAASARSGSSDRAGGARAYPPLTAENLAASTASTVVPVPLRPGTPSAGPSVEQNAPKSVANLLAPAPAYALANHRRDLLLVGVGVALATGAAVTHERWLLPALRFLAPYCEQVQTTCGHLVDGAHGFVFAYKHGVPQAIYGSNGELLPCHTVVHTHLVAPAANQLLG